MEVPKKILNEIADSLEAGFKCFIHRDTFQVVTYLDPYRYPDMDPKDWKEEMSTVKKNRKKFIEIESMESSDSFRIMAEFADSVDDNTIKIRLITALEGHKPFANFKFQIDNSGPFRELWFAFRREKYIEWVQNQLSIESS
jgi:hypothetical protein